MISGFKGEHRWLSNFWPAEISIPQGPNTNEGFITVPTLEHGYVIMKAGCWKVFRTQTGVGLWAYQDLTPGQAKRWGQKIDLRPDWEEVKVDVMRVLLEQKFSPRSELADKLLATGNQLLIEANAWHDNFWGICTCSNCCRTRPALGSNCNQLGHLLVEIRDKLREV